MLYLYLIAAGVVCIFVGVTWLFLVADHESHNLANMIIGITCAVVGIGIAITGCFLYGLNKTTNETVYSETIQSENLYEYDGKMYKIYNYSKEEPLEEERIYWNEEGQTLFYYSSNGISENFKIDGKEMTIKDNQLQEKKSD